VEICALLQKGFVEAQADDGLLEIFGLKQGWHASLVMVELVSAKHIAQALFSFLNYWNLDHFYLLKRVSL
jgi:Diacylglycerol kinase accessory domain